MSGSPVYIDGKLVGAIALRLSVFSPDAICGITPIKLMLEINDFDKTRPSEARTPDGSTRQNVPPSKCRANCSRRVMAAGAESSLSGQDPMMTPIATPSDVFRVSPTRPSGSSHLSLNSLAHSGPGRRGRHPRFRQAC